MLCRLSIMLLIATFLTGCIATNTTPNVVQSGGVVHLNLGGIKRNTANNPPALNEMSAIIYDADGHEFPIKLLKAYRVFPDYTSKFSVNVLNRGNGSGSNKEFVPYDGAFYVTAKLVTNDSAETPLPLAVGPATIAISSAKLIQTPTYGEGSYENISLEILPGVATASDLADYDQYQASVNRRIMPSDISLLNAAYGAQFEILLDSNDYTNVHTRPRVVPLSHDPNISIVQKYLRRTPTGPMSLIVSVTNPAGFVKLTSLSPGKSQLNDLVFALIVPSVIASTQSSPNNSWTLDAANSYYLDANGNNIATVIPVMLPQGQ